MQLPLNCHVRYMENFIGNDEAAGIFRLLEIDYGIPGLKIRTAASGKAESDFGKLMFIEQELYDRGVFPEHIWGKTAVWPPELLPLRHKVEGEAGRKCRVCVCLYYPDGDSWVDYHNDEPAFGDTSVIPSLSLGEERPFLLRENSSGREHSIVLQQGSLLIMGENCQDRYQHCLPKQPRCKKPRINLTFRQYGHEG